MAALFVILAIALAGLGVLLLRCLSNPFAALAAIALFTLNAAGIVYLLAGFLAGHMGNLLLGLGLLAAAAGTRLVARRLP